MSWGWLLLAGVFEVVWAVALRASDGFTRPGWSAVTLVALAASVGCLGLALRGLPLGLAYATWVGIGVAGTAIAGAAWFGEPMSAARWVCVGAILAGIVGLKAAA